MYIPHKEFYLDGWGPRNEFGRSFMVAWAPLQILNKIFCAHIGNYTQFYFQVQSNAISLEHF